MNYSWTRWLKVGRRITLAGSLLAMVGLGIFSAIILNARYTRSGQLIDQAAMDLTKVLHTTTAVLVWNFDTEALEGIRKNTKVSFLETISWKDKSGKPVVPDQEVKKDYPLFTSVLEFTDKNGEKVGTVEVTYNKLDQWHSYIEDARLILIGVSMLFLVQLAGFLGSWWSSRKMVSSLGMLIMEIRNSSNTAYEKADVMKNTAGNVMDIAQDQSASVHETMAALEEIRSMMSRSAENIQESSESASNGDQLVREGKTMVDEMISAVQTIDESNQSLVNKVEESNTQVRGLVTMIQEISQKTKVINEIVFQTKLLSFNAAVEAARAGEHGKGFAVVADEVGNLARMSGSAADEIDRLLSESVQKTEHIVQKVSQDVGSASKMGQKRVQEGVDIAQRCGAVLDQLVYQVGGVKTKMEEVSLAFKEQSLGIQNISTAMQKIEQSTSMNDQNARTGQQVSTELVTEAGRLAEMVESMEQSLFGKSTVNEESIGPSSRSSEDQQQAA